MLIALRRLPPNVWLIGVISLLNDTASDLLYPLMPLYLSSVLMSGPKALGLIEGAAEATSSILKLGSGFRSPIFIKMRVGAIYELPLLSF